MPAPEADVVPSKSSAGITVLFAWTGRAAPLPPPVEERLPMLVAGSAALLAPPVSRTFAAVVMD